MVREEAIDEFTVLVENVVILPLLFISFTMKGFIILPLLAMAL